jgi:hypothetical protein
MTKGITSKSISIQASFTNWKKNYDYRGTGKKINPFSSSRITTFYGIKEIYNETLGKERIKWY